VKGPNIRNDLVRYGTCFLLESPQSVWVVGKGCRQNLDGTERSSRVSRARYTSPMLPRPQRTQSVGLAGFRHKEPCAALNRPRVHCSVETPAWKSNRRRSRIDSPKSPPNQLAREVAKTHHKLCIP